MPSVRSYLPTRKISAWLTSIVLLLPSMPLARRSGHPQPTFPTGPCRKIQPQSIGPVEKVANPSAVRPKLTAALKIHLVFHVPKTKPVVTGPLCPPADPPSSPPVM